MSNQYRKKPVVIEAIQWNGNRFEDTPPEWFRAAMYAEPGTPGFLMRIGDKLVIETLEGQVWAAPGDWIIRGVKGELYPCKPDIFAATYEVASTVAARELDVEAERPVFDDPIRLGEDPYKEMQPYFKKIRNAAPGLEYAIAVGELIAWMNDRINKAERAARSAAQSTAPVSTEQAGDAPAAQLYEWIGEEGSRKKGDLIARTQSELGGNIDLYPHCWKRVGALIQVAPSPNNSPVGGKD